jgi:hypothetical protein
MVRQKQIDDKALTEVWTLPPAATLGSSVRARGILLEIRSRLPLAARKSLDISANALILAMPENARDDFRRTSAIVAGTLKGIEALAVIPREIEDILAISTTERHRWLKDGRLQSAGTRTVRLRGRAKQITFNVFEPRMVEDLLERDVVAIWREEDVATAAENRLRAAWKARVTRSRKTANTANTARAAVKAGPPASLRPRLTGWDEFDRDGLLRDIPDGLDVPDR